MLVQNGRDGHGRGRRERVARGGGPQRHARHHRGRIPAGELNSMLPAAPACTAHACAVSHGESLGVITTFAERAAWRACRGLSTAAEAHETFPLALHAWRSAARSFSPIQPGA